MQLTKSHETSKSTSGQQEWRSSGSALPIVGWSMAGKGRVEMKIDRRAVYDKYDGHCAYCGEKIEFKKMQVDHIISKSRFHINHRIIEYHHNDSKNLNPACRVCNYWKHNFTVDEFRKEILLQVGRLRKYNGKFRFAEKYGLILETNAFYLFYFERTPSLPPLHKR